jgi:hypothetical protein
MGKYSLKLAGLFGLAVTVAVLGPQRALADDDDPPSRVARLGYTHGAVSFQPAGTDDWVSAVVNRPITTGDKLWSDQDSRAELHIGSASIRIFGNTGFSFLNLSDNVTQIQLTAGTLRVRVKRLEENETFEIDTPNLAFSVLRPGTYRVDVDEGGNTTVIKVHGGEGEITGGGSAFALRHGEVGVFNGTDQLVADIESYQNDDDDFDRWCADRDRHEDRAISARYVSPDVIGYQDLDDYGEWRQVPGYGAIWFPQTAVAGWAPYRYGHWAYVSPWGYTWIDDAPWGFAPFHYGRWVNYGGSWGWVPCPPPAPGVVYARPVYAPALVAWIGGPHFSVGISVGGGANVGWFPLGPREVYVPSYPVSRTYVTNVNVSNTTVNTTVVNNYYNTTIVNRNTTVVNNNVSVVHQTYVNQSVAGAVTATTPQAFTSAQSVSKNVVQVDVHEVERAQVNVFTPAVAPAKQAVLGAGASVAVKPPAVIETRAVVAKVAPPPPPVAFAKQQQAIQANGGRPLAVSQVRQIQPQTVQAARPEIKIAPPSKPVMPQNAQGNRGGQPPSAGGNQPGPSPSNGGNAANRPGTPNNSSPGNPAAGASIGPNNSGRPGQGNNSSNPQTENGNANGNHKTFNDRPPSSRPSGGNNNPSSGNADNSNATTMDQKRQQQLERGPSPGNGGSAGNRPGLSNNPSPGNPAGQPHTNAGESSGPNNSGRPGQGNTSGNPQTENGNANANRKTFDDRPASARPSAGNNNSSGNANTNNATTMDLKHQQQLERGPSPSNGGNPGNRPGPPNNPSPGNPAVQPQANAGRSSVPNNSGQPGGQSNKPGNMPTASGNQQQKVQQQPHDEKKNKSSKSEKDDHKHDK